MDLNLKAGIIKNSDGENISPVTSSKTVYNDNGETLYESLNNKVNNNDVLTKTNTTSYTPSDNYHPATKKYVDDNIIGKKGTGINSVKFNNSNTASGGYSHAEGARTTASGGYSHAEGYFTTSSGIGSHAGGYNSYAGGNYGSFAHGSGCIADSQDTVLFVSGHSGSTINIDTSGEKLSTSETAEILAKFKVNQEILLLNKITTNNNALKLEKKVIKSIDLENSTITIDEELPLNSNCKCIINPLIKNIRIVTYPNIALGIGCISLGTYTSCAIGFHTTASGSQSYAEGSNTTASGGCSHAEGSLTTASGYFSHAEGYNTIASGNYSHASGDDTEADKSYMTAIGKYNKTGVDSYFSIGKGTSSSSRANAFRVSSEGAVYGSSAYNSSGADYAEYMEWLDNNINNEDRTGLFVEVKQGKIQIANSYSRRLAGVISSTPSVVGNSYDDQWHGMYLKDEWDRIVYHDVTIPAEYQEIEHVDEETQEITIEKILITEERIEKQPIVNPEYDHTLEYIGRSERPEYGCVGMKGQLLVKSDGTCEVDDFCIPTTGGIATKSEDESIGYLVLEVRENNIIKILL